MLAAFVQKRHDVPLGQAEQMILQRQVSVHGNLCVDGYRKLKRGDVVKVHAFPIAAPLSADDLKIVFEDRHLLVVDKPAGVTSVREPGMNARGKRQATLDELLARRDKSKGNRGRSQPASRQPTPRQPPAIFPVHRLDRDTSGLMLFAKSREAEKMLLERFRHHDIDRAYKAVVIGRPGQRTIESDLVRDRGDGKRGSLPPGQNARGAQHAITHVRPAESIGSWSIVECRLETGRTHQIRIHLSELGHPLCGDKMYRHADHLKDQSDAPRQALHAFRLGLAHPITGRRLKFESDWPEDLAKWLEALRRMSKNAQDAR